MPAFLFWPIIFYLVSPYLFQSAIDKKSGKKKKTYEHGIIDPLSSSQSDTTTEAIDPLSMFAAESATIATTKSPGVRTCLSSCDLMFAALRLGLYIVL